MIAVGGICHTASVTYYCCVLYMMFHLLLHSAAFSVGPACSRTCFAERGSHMVYYTERVDRAPRLVIEIVSAGKPDRSRVAARLIVVGGICHTASVTYYCCVLYMMFTPYLLHSIAFCRSGLQPDVFR